MRQMPLYSNIHGRMIVFWLSNIGVSSHSTGLIKHNFVVLE